MERPSLATWISPAASPPGTEAPETAEAEMTHRGYGFCFTGGNTQREISLSEKFENPVSRNSI